MYNAIKRNVYYYNCLDSLAQQTIYVITLGFILD